MRLSLIALTAAAAGQAASSFAQPVIQAIPERPRIIVEGYGEVKTPPDVATIGYTVRGEGASSDDAVQAMTKIATRIEGALRTIDATAEPRTSEVKVAPVKSADCKERDEDAPQLSVAACAVVGYVAVQPLSVRTAKVSDAGTMVGLASRAGASDAQISDFGLVDPRGAQRAATTAALADAASKASVIASAGHVALGTMLSVTTSNQQGVAITVTGTRRFVAERDEAPPVVVAMQPEPIVTRANLTVTYAITP